MGQCIHTKTHTTKKTGEWHPHVHMFALLDTWIDQEHLSETWHEITGDSFIVDIRRVKKDKQYGYSNAAAEVCKYALKFGDLSVENTWEALRFSRVNLKRCIWLVMGSKSS